jgi:hypothetical protein
MTNLRLAKRLIVAPAGCGKTERLVNFVAEVERAQPALILTHTNAGVAALRDRFIRNKVDPRSYRIATLDGFALRMVRSYPLRSGLKLDLASNLNYIAIRDAANLLLKSAFLQDLIRATYCELFVDEYQDCSCKQHQMIMVLSGLLTTTTFGDPLQSIFGFNTNDPIPSWESDVLPLFDSREDLNVPWRWKNAGTESLGDWVLQARRQLQASEPIKLVGECEHVYWLPIRDQSSLDIPSSVAAFWGLASNKSQSIVVIGDSRNPRSQRDYARKVGAATVVEAVDLKDLLSYASAIESVSRKERLKVVLGFAHEVMTGIDVDSMFSRIQTIVNGKARKTPTTAELSAIELLKVDEFSRIGVLLRTLAGEQSRHLIRPQLYFAMLSAFEQCSGNNGLKESAIKVREYLRRNGRRIGRWSIGSTLLLKGLEADHALILNADEMTKEHFYVAISRGARSVTIFSRKSTIRFK